MSPSELAARYNCNCNCNCNCGQGLRAAGQSELSGPAPVSRTHFLVITDVTTVTVLHRHRLAEPL